MGQRQSRPRATAHDRAVLDVKRQRDALNKSIRVLDDLVRREDAAARTCIGNKDTRGAIRELRRKRAHEKLLDSAAKFVFDLETMVQNLEFGALQVDVLAALQKGSAMLKTMHEAMPIEKAERILSDAQDHVMYQAELDSVVASSALNSNIAMDAEDADAVAELNSIVAAMMVADIAPASTSASALAVRDALQTLPAPPVDLAVGGVDLAVGEHETKTEPDSDSQMVPACEG